MSTDRDASPQDSPPVDRRLVLSLTISFIVVASVIGTALYLREADDGCGTWEQQLHEFSRSLTRHRQVKGSGQIAALNDLEALKLPCQKVGEVRDTCVAAYRHILLAEKKQKQAKRALVHIEKTVLPLDDPQKTIIIRHILHDESIDTIASKLELSSDETQKLYDDAISRPGPDKLTALHRDFEKAIQESNIHIEAAAEKNDACDSSFKRLLEEAQSR